MNSRKNHTTNDWDPRRDQDRCDVAETLINFSVIFSGPLSLHLITRPWVEEGSNLHLRCKAMSTTCPKTHNLPVSIIWQINGANVSYGSDFVTNQLSKKENGDRIVCIGTEENGKPAVSNEYVVSVHCK